MEQLELAYISDGNVKWYNHFGKLSQFLLEINASICPTDPTSRYLSKRSGNIMFTQRLLQTSFIIAVNWKQPWYPLRMKWIFSMFIQWECYTAVKMNELLIHTTVGVNLRNSEKNQTQWSVQYDSIYMQC